MAGMTSGKGAARGHMSAPATGLNMPDFIAFISREHGWALKCAWFIVTLIVATLLTVFRVQLGMSAGGIPLLFYLPAIILVTLTCGLRFGIVSLVLTVVFVCYVFLPPAFGFGPLSHTQIVTLSLWTIVSGFLIAISYFLRVSLQQLSRSEARYRKLVGVTSDIVWVTDSEGNVESPNDAWSRITGMAWPDFSRRRWLKSIHEDDRMTLMPLNVNADEAHQVEFRLWDSKANDWRWFRSRAVAIYGAQGKITEWITAMRDVHEPRLARERTNIILGESRHRLKNLITIIDALAKSSAKNIGANPDTDAFLKRFLGRLHALSAAADLALAGNNKFIELSAVVQATLVPFAEGQHHIKVSGPSLILRQETGGGVALAIHELATNALKYGALSSPNGSVSLTWDVITVPDGERVTIIWQEHGGPAPAKPEREGFGTRVIRAAPARERDGKVDFEYPADGFLCRIAFTQTKQADESSS
jgi:PAS domain S-box-containing protein